MKISLIIPIYMVEDYIEGCLESLINQSDKTEVEFVFIDDGTRDKSMSIVDRYSDQLGNATIIRQANAGLSSARNAGILKAQGEYIWCIDSDDEITPDALRTLKEVISRHSPDVIHIPVERISEGGERTILGWRPGATSQVPTPTFLDHSTGHRIYNPMAQAYCIRRALLEEKALAFTPGIIHEDTLFSLQLLVNTNQIVCLNNALYKYKIRAGSITTSAKALLRLESFATIEDHLERLKSASHSRKIKRALSRRIIICAINQIELNEQLKRTSTPNYFAILRNIRSFDSIYLFIKLVFKRVLHSFRISKP